MYFCREFSQKMDLRDPIIDEIKAYCKSNGIKNVRGEILKYIRIGFSIERYGTSPMDNFRREQVKPKPPKVKDRPETENTPPQVNTGPKIRIIKK